jgi:hypothetical protein
VSRRIAAGWTMRRSAHGCVGIRSRARPTARTRRTRRNDRSAAASTGVEAASPISGRAAARLRSVLRSTATLRRSGRMAAYGDADASGKPEREPILRLGRARAARYSCVQVDPLRTLHDRGSVIQRPLGSATMEAA